MASLTVCLGAAVARAEDFSYPADPSPVARAISSATNPVGVREKMVLALPGGEEVPAILSLPVQGKKPYPVVVLVHGAYDDKKETMLSRFGTRLNAAGIACIAYDLPGHGERSAADKSGFKQALALLILQTALDRGQPVPPEFSMLGVGATTQPAARLERLLSVIAPNIRKSVIDGRRLIDYVASRPEIDGQRIGICGVSLGGGISTLIASADDRVKFACLYVSGARTQYGEGAQGDKVRELYAPVDPLPHAKHFTRPVLMLCGKTDVVILPEESKALLAAFGGEKQIRWYDSGHNFPRASLDDGSRWIAGQFGIVLPTTPPATQPTATPSPTPQ